MQRHPALFVAWRLLLTAFGRLRFIWRRPQLTDAKIDRCFEILSRHRFAILGVGSKVFVTGLFLPRGRYDVEHTAIFVRIGSAFLVIEAVTPVVRVIGLRRFLKQYDNVAIGLLGPALNEQEAIETAFGFVDRPYDVLFGQGRRYLYCHEIGYECIYGGGRMLKKAGQFWVFDDLVKACMGVEEIR